VGKNCVLLGDREEKIKLCAPRFNNQYRMTVKSINYRLVITSEIMPTFVLGIVQMAESGMATTST
jgi:hypothetical protein